MFKNKHLFSKCKLTIPTAIAEMTVLVPTLNVNSPSATSLEELSIYKEEQTWLVSPKSIIQGDVSSLTKQASKDSKSDLLSFSSISAP